MTAEARIPSSRPRRGLRILLATALVVGVAWLGRGIIWDLIYRGSVVETLGSEDVVDVIRNADNVTAQRMRLLDPNEQPQPEGDGFFRQNYVPIDDAVAVSQSQAEHLIRLLTSGRSFGWLAYGELGCLPSYGVKLQFQRGDQRKEVWLCFECDVLVSVDDSDVELHRMRSFLYIRNDLADLMRGIFPDDEAIQALERR